MVSDYSMQRVSVGADRERFVDLLLLADESEQQVRSYLHRGDLYAYSADHVVIGVILAIPIDDLTVELKAVAVDEHYQRRGLGNRMLLAVLEDLRARGVKRVIVGTSNAGIGQLAYYQKAGFRLLRIERDFFSPERGYPEVMVEEGIRLRDMVWMDLSLDESVNTPSVR